MIVYKILLFLSAQELLIFKHVQPVDQVYLCPVNIASLFLLLWMQVTDVCVHVSCVVSTQSSSYTHIDGSRGQWILYVCIYTHTYNIIIFLCFCLVLLRCFIDSYCY